MYRTEFHVHTRYSKDSTLSYFLLLLVLKIKKIDTVAITDHNEIAGAIKYKNKFKKHGIELIVGEEIFTNQGEIIGLGLSTKIEPDLSPEDTIRQIKEQNGFVYIPHPYDEKRYKTVLIEKEIEKNKNEIDFIEIHNGRNISPIFDVKQNKIAEKYELTKIIGSDAHTFFELGRNYIITENKITTENLKEEYKNVVFNKKKCIKFSHKCTKIVRIINIFLRRDFNELHRIINKKCRRKM